MTFKTHLQDPCNTLRIGMFFLILANLSRYFLHPGNGLSEDWTDGITGLFYGLAIATLLLSVIRRRRA
jgi:hypothetical protein